MSISYDKRQIDLASQLGERLMSLGWRVTTAESCTGGGIAAAITAVPGSSAWFDMGFVTYSNEAKIRLLSIDGTVIASEGAVSLAVAESMAKGALVKADADIAVSITGVAGPDGGSVEKPVGTVCFAWSLKSGAIRSEVHYFSGDRNDVRAQAVLFALQGLLLNSKKSGNTV